MVILSVRELAVYIHQLLEYDEVLADIWVEGEVSNLARSRAGHVYFTLKEEQAQVSCALFRRSAMRQERLPTDGEAVLAHGKVSFYEAGGKLQLYVDTVRPQGVGLLYAQFQELKARLEAEGLFDETLKRPLPPFPRRIGVVTSPTAAARATSSTSSAGATRWSKSSSPPPRSRGSKRPARLSPPFKTCRAAMWT